MPARLCVGGRERGREHVPGKLIEVIVLWYIVIVLVDAVVAVAVAAAAAACLRFLCLSISVYLLRKQKQEEQLTKQNKATQKKKAKDAAKTTRASKDRGGTGKTISIRVEITSFNCFLALATFLLVSDQVLPVNQLG